MQVRFVDIFSGSIYTETTEEKYHMTGEIFMSSVVQVRNVRFGEGIPKICIPFTDKDCGGLSKSIASLKNVPYDFVEWRADHYEGLMEPEKLSGAMKLLRDGLSAPLLFTIRTRAEGGEAGVSAEDYTRLNLLAIESGLVDLIDVELSMGEGTMRTLVDAAHKANVKVIASRHDFHATPDKAVIVESLCRMQDLGADMAKFAVMPRCERDVLTLLDATLEMKEHHADTPVITMSMGELGAVSRVCGRLSGSCVTFGTVAGASAPGQLPAEVLSLFLKSL